MNKEILIPLKYFSISTLKNGDGFKTQIYMSGSKLYLATLDYDLAELPDGFRLHIKLLRERIEKKNPLNMEVER